MSGNIAPEYWQWPGSTRPGWIDTVELLDDCGGLRLTSHWDSCPTYDELRELSTLFGTNDINYVTESREAGYCETCCFSYDVTTVVVSSVTQWPNWSLS